MPSLLVKLKKLLKQFFLINDSPHKVAAGAALGIFFGIMPGEGVATTLIFASIFRFNRLSATAGVLATNMWTTLVILPPAAYVGALLFGKNYSDLMNNFHSTYQLGWKHFLSETIFTNLLLPLLVGFIIVSGIISLAFYFLLYFLLKTKKLQFK